MSHKTAIRSCFVLLFFLLTTSGHFPAYSQMKIGFASADITPTESIMLVGYAGRTETSKGIIHPLYAKAMAFEDSTGKRAVLVSTDLIGLFRDLSSEIANRVEKELKISRENLMLTSSHTHTAPLLHKSNLNMYDLSEQQITTIANYTEKVKQGIFEVIKKSLHLLAPMKITFGKSEASFAVNRRVFKPERIEIGINEQGPVDNQVPVLVAADTSGQERAIVFGYACHGTTIKDKDYFLVCGDYMGFARDYLEWSQPGLMSLFVAGCGADINPFPRGSQIMARLHGLQLAGAVAEVIVSNRQIITGPLTCSLKIIELPFAKIPSAAELQEHMNSENPHLKRYATYFLTKLEQGQEIPSTYPYPIQIWQFGKDLTVIALGGEVVVDYSLRLKGELGISNLWTIAYANDVCGYIGSARTLYEGGYEADESTIYYTLPGRWDFSVEERIILNIKEMLREMER